MRTLSKFMLVLLFIGIFSIYFAVQNFPILHSDQQPTTLSDWQYRWGESPVNENGIPLWITETDTEKTNWTSIEQPFNPEGRGDYNELWFKVYIPQGAWRDPSLKLQVHQKYEIYTQERLIYLYGEMDAINRDLYPGISARLISLPNDALGNFIYIHIYSNSAEIGVSGKPIMGSKSDILLNVFLRDVDKLIFGSFYILIGIIFMYSFFIFRNQKLFISFATFSIFFGIFSMCRMTSIYYLYDHVLLWMYLEMYSLNLGLVGLIMFIEHMFGAGIFKFVRRMWQFHLVYGLSAGLLLSMGIVSFTTCMNIYQVVILITMVINILTIYCEMKKGQREAKLIMYGSLIICIRGAWGITESLYDVQTSWSYLLSYGVTAFILMILLQLVKRMMELMLVARNSEKLSMVSQMAAGVAHEIRNPISVISGFVQLIKQDPSNIKFLDLISSEINRMDGIVSDFLLFSKPTKESMSKWNVNMIMKESLELFKAQMSEKRISLEFITDEELPMIRCEANQLKQVFINIIKNAIESMKEEDKLIVTVQRDDRNWVRIRIIDQGIGISPKDLLNLGQPFYTTKEQGTGLGLMICVRFIEYHGGTLQFQSKVNEGTTVDILLPVHTPVLTSSGMTY